MLLKEIRVLLCMALVLAIFSPVCFSTTLPDSLRIYVQNGQEAWTVQLVEESRVWLKSLGITVEVQFTNKYDIIAMVIAGEWPDLVISGWSLHGPLTNAGGEAFLSTTGTTPDIWRPVFLTRENSDIHTLQELSDRSLAGYIFKTATVAGLAAANITLNQLKGWWDLQPEEAITRLLAGSVDAVVIGSEGLRDFYDRDLTTLLGLRVIGYGLPVPARCFVHAAPQLSEEVKRALRTALIEHSFGEVDEIGFGWVDGDELDQLARIKELRGDLLADKDVLEALRSELKLEEDRDGDGVSDLFDECPYTSEAGDNTVEYLARDGCPCIWDAQGSAQVLHLLEPAIIPLDEELSKLAEVAETYGYADLSSQLQQAAAAAGEDNPCELLNALDAAMPTYMGPVLACLPTLVALSSNAEKKKKGILGWLNDKIHTIKNVVRSAKDYKKYVKYAYPIVKYTVKKTGGRVSRAVLFWSTTGQRKMRQFQRSIKASKGLTKALWLADKLLWIVEHGDPVVTAYAEAYYLRESEEDFLLEVDRRLKKKYKDKYYIWQAVKGLIPYDSIVDGIDVLRKSYSTVKEWAVEKWGAAGVTPPDTPSGGGAAMHASTEQIKGLLDAAEYQKNHPEHSVGNIRVEGGKIHVTPQPGAMPTHDTIIDMYTGEITQD